MKVIISKDDFGVEIWREGANLRLKPCWSLHNNPVVDRDPMMAWRNMKNFIFRDKDRLFKGKQVKKLFPELIGKLNNRTVVTGYLRITSTPGGDD